MCIPQRKDELSIKCSLKRSQTLNQMYIFTILLFPYGLVVSIPGSNKGISYLIFLHNINNQITNVPTVSPYSPYLPIVPTSVNFDLQIQ